MSARPELVPPAGRGPLAVRVYESSAGWCVRFGVGASERIWYLRSEIEARLVARAVRRWAADLGAK